MELPTKVCSLQLRLPADLKAWLKNQAKGNCRSLNGEIVARLVAGRDKEIAKEKAAKV